MSYVLGLDLGQLGDRTALSVVERVVSETAEEHIERQRQWDAGTYLPAPPPVYHCRHLQVWQPGTHQTDIVDGLAAIIAAQSALKGCYLIVDVTVAGLAAAELIRKQVKGVRIITCEITAGMTVEQSSPYAVRLPKRELAAVMRVLLETKRFSVARNLLHGDALQAELGTFKVKAIKGDTEMDWRERAHDDLVLATAMACWQHENKKEASVSFV